jgi:valyl-tRNA synthetase
MPFVTEELWEKRAPEGAPRESLLMLTEWPSHQGLRDAAADEEIGWVIRLVTDVRSVRAEMNVPAGAKVPLVITGAEDKTKARIAAHLDTVSRLARIESIDFADTPPTGSVQIVLDEATIALPLEGVIDIDAEADRLKREIDKVGAEITQIDAKLANDKFVSRAPQHVVEEQRERRADAEATATKLTQALKRLEAAL